MKKILVILLIMVVFISGCVLQKERPKPITPITTTTIIGQTTTTTITNNKAEICYNEIDVTKGNPASLFCICMGGTTSIEETLEGQKGLCKIGFKTYEEWEYFDLMNPNDDTYSPKPKSEDAMRCERVGGEWRLFSNGCADTCGPLPRFCTQALTWGCDCGATKCWGEAPSGCITNEDGTEICSTRPLPSCIDDPYEPDVDLTCPDKYNQDTTTLINFIKEWDLGEYNYNHHNPYDNQFFWFKDASIGKVGSNALYIKFIDDVSCSGVPVIDTYRGLDVFEKTDRTYFIKVIVCEPRYNIPVIFTGFDMLDLYIDEFYGCSIPKKGLLSIIAYG